MGRHDPDNRFRRALEGLTGVAATEGNRVDVLLNGDEIFPAMLDAIRGAERTIDFLTFVYWEGSVGEEFAEALAERAKAGLRVRVLLDALGAVTMDKSLVEEMDGAGVEVELFRPVDKLRFWEADHRTHRKVLICDEDVAFTGGVGIADEWGGDARSENEWRDTHFQLRGPAVDGLRAAFVQNWAETGRPLFDDDVDQFPMQPTDGPVTVQVLRGAAESGWSDIAIVFRTLLRLAKEQIRITTAYFVPDDHTLDQLCDASSRGVDVQVLVPGPHIDKRFVQLAGQSQFERLLEAGVKVWAFQPSMLHAKIMTVDGAVANVGSANFDSRSLLLDDEVNFVAFDRELTARLDRDFDADVERSEKIDPSQWEDRSLLEKAKETATSLIDKHL